MTFPTRFAPRAVVMEAWPNVAAHFGRPDIDLVPSPLLAAGRGGQLAIAFGDGLVAIFGSSLPAYRPPDWNFSFWQQPLLVAAAGLIGVYTFYRQRNQESRPRINPEKFYDASYWADKTGELNPEVLREIQRYTASAGLGGGGGDRLGAGPRAMAMGGIPKGPGPQGPRFR